MLSNAFNYIAQKIKHEMKCISSYHVNSVLRKSSPEVLQSFQWKDLIAELNMLLLFINF